MKVWHMSPENVDHGPDEQALLEAAEVLKNGGLVAFPTETVYGLGANAWNEEAVRSIFTAKGRPADNPLIVHVADASDIHQLVDEEQELAPTILRAVEAFWPGPLTVIIPAHKDIAPSVRAGLSTIGVRCPSHPIASALIRQAGCPVAAPSANRSGRPSPTTAQDVIEDMQGRIDGVIDGGPCQVGVESTVVAIGPDSATIYRPGAITPAQLEDVLGIPVTLDAHLTSTAEAPKAPGMKYRHYAPNAEVHVWVGSEEDVAVAMEDFAKNHPHSKITKIIPGSSHHNQSEWTWSPGTGLGARYAVALGREIYRLLREFDRRGADYILIHGVESIGFGQAVMNRLEKSSEGRVHRL